MNCAWCGRNTDGSDSHGICDECMSTFFHVNPKDIHDEIEQEAKQQKAGMQHEPATNR